MRRLLLAVASILIGFQSLAATLPLGPGSIFPIGPSVTGSGGAIYYVANGGSDTNNGLSAATAWQTIGKVNGSGLGPNVTVLFNGGQTFSGGLVITQSVSPSNITIASYGTGQATISSGNSAACVSATNVAGVNVSNIICTGGGNATNTTAGISIVNSQAGNTKLAGPTISGNTISGYGGNGIEVKGTSGTSGFNVIAIASNTVTNVTGISTDAFGTACIFVYSPTGYGSGATTPAHTNVTITGNVVSNCTGAAAASANWSGSGILVSETGGSIIIAGNVAHDFGGSNGSTFEPLGIFVADSAPSSCLVSYNEAYNGLQGPNGADPDGFGFDGGVTGCIGEYNKVHDNAGLGWLLENYTDGTCCVVWGNNTVRFNLFQNDCSAAPTHAEIGFHFPLAATAPVNVYGNTIVNQVDCAAIGDSSSSTGSVTATIANNILAVNNGGFLINFSHPIAVNMYGNDYYTYGTAAKFAWNGTTYSNASVATAFAAWQTATGQEKISGSNVGLTNNPQIYVPGGLWATNGYVPTSDMASNLQAGSPMIGAGVNILSQFGINPGATDYYGVAISAASLPVGAANGDFGTFTASCTPSSNFLARVSSFNKQDDVQYNSVLCHFLAQGVLNLTDLLYLPAAPNSAASLLNLISTSFSLTAHGTTTFTARTGIAGNGSTGWLDTGWVPSVNGVNYTLASATHMAYALTNGLGSSAPLYGAQNKVANSETSNYAGSGSWYADANDFSGTTSPAITSSAGSLWLNRASGLLTPFFNGVEAHQAAIAPVATPDQNMILLAFNAGTGSGTVANQFNANTLAAVMFGSGAIDQSAWLVILSFMQGYGINKS